MSYHTILFAVSAGVLRFILMNSLNPIHPILVTNILLGLITGELIGRKKP